MALKSLEKWILVFSAVSSALCTQKIVGSFLNSFSTQMLLNLVVSFLVTVFLWVWWVALRNRSAIGIRLTTIGFVLASLLGVAVSSSLALREEDFIFAVVGSLVVGGLWYLGCRRLWGIWPGLVQEIRTQSSCRGAKP